MAELQTIKIVPTKITPRQVNTQRGPSTVFDIETASGQRYSCWSKELVDTLEVNKEVEIQYTVSQKGEYTNYTIIDPNSKGGQANQINDRLEKIWNQMQKNHEEVVKKIDESIRLFTIDKIEPNSDTKEGPPTEVDDDIEF